MTTNELGPVHAAEAAALARQDAGCRIRWAMYTRFLGSRLYGEAPA